MTRLRIRFAKLGKIRWTSHRDTARMWERAFRRVNLPIAYSNGFSPRPRVSFGLALSTGYESVAEYLDVELSNAELADVAPSNPKLVDVAPGSGVDVASASRANFGPGGGASGIEASEGSGRGGEPGPSGDPVHRGEPSLDLEALTVRISAALPAGLDVLAISASEDRSLSLQEEVTVCTWRLAVVSADSGVATPDIGDRIGGLLAAESLVIARTRKGREVVEDIRPAILAIRDIEPAAEGVWFECDLATQPRSLRPTELVAALGADLEERSVRRLHQWIERDGARREPLAAPLAATDAPHALVRAS